MQIGMPRQRERAHANEQMIRRRLEPTRAQPFDQRRAPRHVDVERRESARYLDDAKTVTEPALGPIEAFELVGHRADITTGTVSDGRGMMELGALCAACPRASGLS